METLNHGILRFNDECTLKINFDQETDDMKVTRINDVTGEEKVITGGGQGGGDMDWKILYDGVTESEGNLSVAVTNVSCNEFMVLVKAIPTADIQIYVSPNQPNGTHYESGYGRTAISTGTSTGNPKIGFVYVMHTIGNMTPMFKTANMEYQEGSVSVQFTMPSASQTLALDEPYTSISVATYQAIAAGTEVVVLGR